MFKTGYIHDRTQMVEGLQDYEQHEIRDKTYMYFNIIDEYRSQVFLCFSPVSLRSTSKYRSVYIWCIT